MFIAHAPAGYLLSRAHPSLRKYAMWIVLGSVFPDIDMFYFYLISDGTAHHHS